MAEYFYVLIGNLNAMGMAGAIITFFFLIIWCCGLASEERNLEEASDLYKKIGRISLYWFIIFTILWVFLPSHQQCAKIRGTDIHESGVSSVEHIYGDWRHD